jgi:hypothetical protein
MNTDRLLRAVEKRLSGIPDAVRDEVMDAVREEIGRERRGLDPSLTVETERERRIEAETLRAVLEAINRQARLEETIGEVLKQLDRIVAFDACTLSLIEPGGRTRVLGARGPIDAPAQTTAEIPLLVEGVTIGLLTLSRGQEEPFEDIDLHRARAVAFSASAAIQKARLLGQVHRYATLMERVVAVDQTVFAKEPLEKVAQVILDGAVQIGHYRGGLLVVALGGKARIAAATGEELAAASGKPAPKLLDVETLARLQPGAASAAGKSLGVRLPETEIYLVPLATEAIRVGSLALFDPDGETPDDRLMEAYASRAAAAYLHAADVR